MKLAHEPTKQILMQDHVLAEKSSSWQDELSDLGGSSSMTGNGKSQKIEALFYLGLAKLATSRQVPEKRVRFSTVQVREYALTLGDHPQPEAYPVSLDWKHADDFVVLVDQYQQNSPASPGTMHMTRLQRRQRLAAIMGLAPIELTIQEEKRQSRERELELLSCPFRDDCDDDEVDDPTDDQQQNACISDSFDSDGYADDIDSCCSDLSDDESDDSDIVLLADAAPLKRPPTSLDKSQYSPIKRKGSIVVDWNNTRGNDSLLEDFEEEAFFKPPTLMAVDPKL